MSNTIRFSKLLGECRRQMNGAVAGSMRYYGADYGLNYGVSLPTIRSLAHSEGKDHAFAKYLYMQQVREIRLASFHIANAAEVTPGELSFWAEGIINSEVAEEASFALFQYVDCVTEWLSSEDELLIYTALLSLAKSKKYDLQSLENHIIKAVELNQIILSSAVVVLLENYYRDEQNRAKVIDILSALSESKAAKYIRDEMAWRCECYD
ncbi:MAG: DNA alkylation repair enzyme [Rikenellaceae bacterium]